MSWFEAWLIWRVGAIQSLFEWLIFFGILSFIVLAMMGIASKDTDINEKWRTIWRRISRWGFPIVTPILFISILMSVVTPDTSTLFKIIATKYGADAFTSQKAEQIGNNVLDSIEKAQRVIDQKLDRLIEKEKPSENK